MLPEYDLTPEEARTYMVHTKDQPVRDVIAAQCKDADSVLEFACGNGIDAERYRTEQYWGIDWSPALIRAAREAHPGYRFDLQDARSTAFPGTSFDVVFGKGFIEHQETQEDALRVLAEMMRVARRTVFLAWHMPPWQLDAPVIERVLGHFGRTVSQNRYQIDPFAKLIGSRKWSTVVVDQYHLWRIEC